MVFDTPSPCSANVDAHWLTACSLAPAHVIISIRIQKTRLLQRSRILIPSSDSSTSGAIGTRVKITPLTIGTTAQTHARIFQFPIPNSLKNRVEINTTPTWPQQ